MFRLSRSLAGKGRYSFKNTGSGVVVARSIPHNYARYASGIPSADSAIDSAKSIHNTDIDTTTIMENLSTVAAGNSDIIAAAPEAANKFTMFAMNAIDYIHTFAGVPYWEAIAITTIGVRVFLLPLGVKTIKSAARMAAMKPESDKLQKKFNGDPNSTHPSVKLQYQQEMMALFKKHKVNPLGSLLLPIIQLPVFMTFFFALQDMPTYFPALATGGTLWFTNLCQHDSTLVLPIMNSLSMLIMLEMGADGAQQANNKTFKVVMRGFALLVCPITMYMPQSVFMYWMTNNVFSIIQTVVLKSKPIRKLLDIPDAPVQTASSSNQANPFEVIMKEIEKNREAKNQAAVIIDGNGSAAKPPPPPPTVKEPPVTFSHPPKKSKV